MLSGNRSVLHVCACVFVCVKKVSRFHRVGSTTHRLEGVRGRGSEAPPLSTGGEPHDQEVPHVRKKKESCCLSDCL